MGVGLLAAAMGLWERGSVTRQQQAGVTGEAPQPLLPAECQGVEKGPCAGSPRSEGV